MLVIECSEVFYLTYDSHSGVLLSSIPFLLYYASSYLPLLLLVCLASGLSLNILAHDLPVTDGLVKVVQQLFNVDELSINFAVDGPFFAPFWGIYDVRVLRCEPEIWATHACACVRQMHYSPDDLATLPNESFATPVFVWVYLMLLLVIFGNLLIATFTTRMDNLVRQSDAYMKMTMAQFCSHYVCTYPVPPPFNMLAVAVSVLCALTRWLCHEASMHSAWSGHVRSTRIYTHYPKRLHMPDNEVEMLLVQARKRFHEQQAHAAWREDLRHTKRFDRLDKELREMRQSIAEEQREMALAHFKEQREMAFEIMAIEKVKATRSAPAHTPVSLPTPQNAPIPPPPGLATGAAPAEVVAATAPCSTRAPKSSSLEGQSVNGLTSVPDLQWQLPSNGHASRLSPPVLATPDTRLDRRATIRL
jgi:hypothetical protein